MIREMKMRPKCDPIEYQTKLGHAIRFLTTGNQLRLTVMFRGREITHPEMGERLLLTFVPDLEKYANAELPPVMEDRHMSLLFTPKG